MLVVTLSSFSIHELCSHAFAVVCLHPKLWKYNK